MGHKHSHHHNASHGTESKDRKDPQDEFYNHLINVYKNIIVQHDVSVMTLDVFIVCVIP